MNKERIVKMTERKARRAADDNVADVINTIESYSCGSIRALAQDPPQNALDARLNGQQVHVVYELMQRYLSDGKKMMILTITDSGTTGLQGPTLNYEDLVEREREMGRLELKPGEDWAAWEANRYTKTGQEKLGSRGQGKSAYLYHSKHPVSLDGADQMIILYDTLLPEGEYRLGIRYHNPATKVIEPPYRNDAAKEIVNGEYVDEYFGIPLQLDPLTKVGTRVIIPFLSEEAIESINGKEEELKHWLQAQWWRSIQKENLKITLIREGGLREDIPVFDRWDGEPWKQNNTSYSVYENEPLASQRLKGKSHWKIKRAVLSIGDYIDKDIDHFPAQFRGIQLLRGDQWITTLDINENEYIGLIPDEYKAGFCGFIEFESKLEGELREIEKPAHDGFIVQKQLYREIKTTIRDLVERFSKEQGWYEEAKEYDPRLDDLVKEVVEAFNLDTRDGIEIERDVKWECSVSLNSRRFDWEDTLFVSATCSRIPSRTGDMISFHSSLISPDGSKADLSALRSQRLSSRNDQRSTAGVDFGKFVVSAPQFKLPGRYRVEVDCSVEGRSVKKGSAEFYVEEDPPIPPRHLTMSVTAVNNFDGSKIIPENGELFWKVTVRNSTENSITGELIVTIADTPNILYRNHIEAKRPQINEIAIPISYDGISQIDDLDLLKGKYSVLASMEDSEGDLLSAASDYFFVGEIEDLPPGGGLPFSTSQINQFMSPRWNLKEPGVENEYILEYSGYNSNYRALQAQKKKRGQRHPVDNYFLEIICEGIIEWVACEMSKGDEGKMYSLVRGIKSRKSNEGERFEVLIHKLFDETIEQIEHSRIHRQLSAIMFDIFMEKGA